MLKKQLFLLMILLDRESIGGAPGEHKQEDFVASGEGKQGGGKWLHTPDVPWTSQGVGGLQGRF